MPVTEVADKTFITSVNSKLMALNFNAGYGSRRQNLLYFRKFKAYGIKFQYQLRKYPAKLTLLP